LDTHPLFTGRCPRCEPPFPQYETPPVVAEKNPKKDIVDGVHLVLV
jgi:hypothetical protein